MHEKKMKNLNSTMILTVTSIVIFKLHFLTFSLPIFNV